ncbi:hypothetical protein N7465_000660 [Penicillium sp. CMV-2018d]|nr:hypothetical protein N7465_000660 [Penicillium sp. CMV-2018d]
MNDLHLNAEGLWRYGPVIHKDLKYDLVGRPDYSLWYCNEEDIGRTSRNWTAYGVVSDGQWWVFLKINNDSEWSEHIIPARLGNYQEVLGIRLSFEDIHLRPKGPDDTDFISSHRDIENLADQV